jgi:hypothetical protein
MALALELQHDSTRRSATGSDLVARERAKMCALGTSGSSGLLAIANAKEAPAPPKAGAQWWMEQGPAITP